MLNIFQTARQISCNDAAQRLGLQGRRTSPGRGLWLCPFHDDQHASMVCYDVNSHFHCFSCQAHGDAINLYAQVLGLPVKQAAERACRDFGLTWDVTRYPPQPEPGPDPNAAAAARGMMTLCRVWKAFLLRIARQVIDNSVIQMERLADPDHPEWNTWLARAVRFQDEYNRVNALTEPEMLELIKEELAEAEEKRQGQFKEGF